MSGMRRMTMKRAVADFIRTPTVRTAYNLRIAAHEHNIDGMISDDELWNILADTEDWSEANGIELE